MARTYSFTYAGLTIGGASATYRLNGPIRIHRAYRRLHASCTCMVVATTTAGFQAARQALETAFTTPRGTLVLVQDSTTETFSHSANTGFQAQPNFEWLDTEFDSDRTREIVVSVTLETPADASGEQGFVDWESVAIRDNSGIRTLSITGQLSAQSGTDAEAQFLSIISSFLTARKDEEDASADWKEIQRSIKRRKEDKGFDFAYTFRERIFKDGASTASIANIRSAVVTAAVSHDRAKALAIPGLARDVAIVVSYLARIDKAYTQASEENLKTIWTDTCLPLIKDTIATYGPVHDTGDTEAEIMEISPVFDPTTSTIKAEVVAVIPGSPIRQLIVSYTRQTQPPWATLPVFSGIPFDKIIVPSVGEIVVMVKVAAEVEGDLIDAEDAARTYLGSFLNPGVKPNSPDVIPLPPPGSFPQGKSPADKEYSEYTGVANDFKLLSPQDIAAARFSANLVPVPGQETVAFDGPSYHGEPEIQVSRCAISTAAELIFQSVTPGL